MGGKAWLLCWAGLLGIAVALGCSSKPADKPDTNEEGLVREKFAELQSAIKNRDAEKIWALLDARSRGDAERAAKNLQTAYNQAGTEEKRKLEETLGLSGKELAGLDGKSFLKSKRFQKKYDEVPEGKIEKVSVEGDSATVHFLEPDGDNEKAIFLRQDGTWKVWLTMPKGNKP